MHTRNMERLPAVLVPVAVHPVDDRLHTEGHPGAAEGEVVDAANERHLGIIDCENLFDLIAALLGRDGAVAEWRLRAVPKPLRGIFCPEHAPSPIDRARQFLIVLGLRTVPLPRLPLLRLRPVRATRRSHQPANLIWALLAIPRSVEESFRMQAMCSDAVATCALCSIHRSVGAFHQANDAVAFFIGRHADAYGN